MYATAGFKTKIDPAKGIIMIINQIIKKKTYTAYLTAFPKPLPKIFLVSKSFKFLHVFA